MSLLTQSRIAQDMHIVARIAVAAAVAGAPDTPPTGWALKHVWELSATPGWTDAYEACECVSPGECPDAITDEMIVTAVSLLVASQIPDDPPEYPDPDPA